MWPTGYILGISHDYITSTALLGSSTLHSVTSTFDIPPVPSIAPPNPPTPSHSSFVPAEPTIIPPTPPQTQTPHADVFAHFDFISRYEPPLEHVALRKDSYGSFRLVESDDEDEEK